jgi:hypothetical protein
LLAEHHAQEQALIDANVQSAKDESPSFKN